MKPTKWFVLKPNDSGEVTAVGRWYWPESTMTEVWAPGDTAWREVDAFLRFHEEPDWEPSDEATVEAWIAALV